MLKCIASALVLACMCGVAHAQFYPPILQDQRNIHNNYQLQQQLDDIQNTQRRMQQQMEQERSNRVFNCLSQIPPSMTICQ